MNFYQYTQNWYDGEIFEGRVILIVGSILILISLLFWKLGTTPNAKSIVIPLLMVGLLFTIGIGIMMRSYPERMKQSESAYNQDPTGFIQSEKKRVEDFQILYKYSVGFAAISFLLTIIAFGFVEHRIFQSLCIALMIISVGLIIIDHFSKERAQIYYFEILKHTD